jgi:hypothetical protein
MDLSYRHLHVYKSGLFRDLPNRQRHHELCTLFDTPPAFGEDMSLHAYRLPLRILHPGAPVPSLRRGPLPTVAPRARALRPLRSVPLQTQQARTQQHRLHGCRAHETLFSIRIHRGSLDAFCAPTGLALASSLRVDVAHLTQLTLSSTYPYDWSCFFRHPMPGRGSSACSQCSRPSASASHSRSRSSPPSPPPTSAPRRPGSVPTSAFSPNLGLHS